MKIAIMTDSNSGITQEQAKELGIFLTPMPFLINGEEYFEGVNLTQEEFYQKLTENADVSTSQPSIYTVSETWTEILKSYDEIIYIPMSSGLSASCQTAINASKDFNGKVHVIDNKRISVTQKQSVLDAKKLADQGKTANEIEEWLLKTATNANIYIMVDTLKYLKKGGRVTPAAAAIGTILKIKPILLIKGEKLDKYAKVMATNAGKSKMIEQIVKDLKTEYASQVVEGKMAVSMAYTNCREKCLQFAQEANKVLSDYNIQVDLIDPLSLSVSCHIGSGAIAITCYETL